MLLKHFEIKRCITIKYNHFSINECHVSFIYTKVIVLYDDTLNRTNTVLAVLFVCENLNCII